MQSGLIDVKDFPKSSFLQSAEGKHLRLVIGGSGKTINAVGFGMGEYADYLKQNDIIDVAFNLDINDFKGTKSVQLILKDIKKKL